VVSKSAKKEVKKIGKAVTLVPQLSFSMSGLRGGGAGRFYNIFYCIVLPFML
jgi:hypothetical protein